MKYLTLLLFLLGGFLTQVDGQTILDYDDYILELKNSTDPSLIGEAERIIDFTTNLYSTIYFAENNIHIVGDYLPKKLVADVESLDLVGYDTEQLVKIEMIIVLVKREDLISSGQIPKLLITSMPNLKYVVIIANFKSQPSDFTSILTPEYVGYVPLFKESITE